RRHTRFSRDWSSDVCSSDLRTGRRRERALMVRSGHEGTGRHRPAAAGGLAELVYTPAEPAVAAVRHALRLAAAVDPGRIHRPAPVLARTGLAARRGDAPLRTGAALQPIHPQRTGAGTGSYRAAAGGRRS